MYRGSPSLRDQEALGSCLRAKRRVIRKTTRMTQLVEELFESQPVEWLPFTSRRFLVIISLRAIVLP
jgi:hypothetical protein